MLSQPKPAHVIKLKQNKMQKGRKELGSETRRSISIGSKFDKAELELCVWLLAALLGKMYSKRVL